MITLHNTKIPESLKICQKVLDKVSKLGNDIISEKESKLRLWCFGAPGMFCDR